MPETNYKISPRLPSPRAVFDILQDQAKIEYAHRQIASGKASLESYADQARVWAGRASLYSACRMIRHGLASPADFAAKVPAWIAAATPGVAAKMIHHGLASPADFACRLPSWRQIPQYSFWREYAKVDTSVATPQIVKEWVKSASYESAWKLVEDGLATPADFTYRVSSWADFGPKDRLHVMPDHGMLSEEDAHDTREVSSSVRFLCSAGKPVSPSLRESCLSYGDGSAVRRLISHGHATMADCSDRIEEWLAEVSPDTAPYLVKYRFASAEDVWSRLGDAVNSLTISLAYPLYCMGVLTGADMAYLRGVWREAGISPSDLPMALGIGGVSDDEAMAHFALYGDEGTMENPKFARLVRSRMELDSLVGEKVIARFQHYQDGGAAVRVNGIGGFVMPSELNWMAAERRIGTFVFGDMLPCEITRFSMKDLTLRLDPPEGSAKGMSIAEQFPPGTRVRGEVASVQDYGLFVSFAPGLMGFVFRGEVSWERKVKSLNTLFRVGDEVEAVVLGVDEAERKVSLSIKRTTEDPWQLAAAKCVPGARIRGKITDIANYGVFVEVAPGVRGLVHVSELDWRDMDVKVRNYGFQPGDEVDVVVKSFDAKNRRVNLSIKDAMPNPWLAVERDYPVGKVVKGVVRRTANSLAFVELPGGVTALLHLTEIADPPPEAMPLSVGDEVEARVVASSAEFRRIRISVRALMMPDAEFAALADQSAKELRARANKGK